MSPNLRNGLPDKEGMRKIWRPIIINDRVTDELILDEIHEGYGPSLRYLINNTNVVFKRPLDMMPPKARYIELVYRGKEKNGIPIFEKL